MTSKDMDNLVRIELVSEKGTFTFKEHHSTEVSPYDALVAFEANNWEMLGKFHYVVVTSYEDFNTKELKEESLTLDGINASAHLSAYFNEEVAAEINAYYQSQY